jgi:hypothetical protein
MNTNSQAQRGHVGRAGGAPNYKNVEDGVPYGGDEAGEEDIIVVTANIAVNEVNSSKHAEGAAEVCPRPPSLPAFGGGRVFNTAATTVSSSGSRGVLAEIGNQQQGGVCHQ